MDCDKVLWTYTIPSVTHIRDLFPIGDIFYVETIFHMSKVNLARVVGPGSPLATREYQLWIMAPKYAE